MNDDVAAERYTHALFELAKKEKRVAETDAALLVTAKVLSSQPKFLLLMDNPTIPDREKYDLALGLIGGKKKGLLERFFRVLIDKKRFSLLPDIQKIFHDRFEKMQGVQEITMLSAVPLPSKVLEKFKTALAKKLHSEVRLIPRVDRDILGGFIIRFAGKEIDFSFKNRLYEIRQKLFSSAEGEPL